MRLDPPTVPSSRNTAQLFTLKKKKFRYTFMNSFLLLSDRLAVNIRYTVKYTVNTRYHISLIRMQNTTDEIKNEF